MAQCVATQHDGPTARRMMHGKNSACVCAHQAAPCSSTLIKHDGMLTLINFLDPLQLIGTKFASRALSSHHCMAQALLHSRFKQCQTIVDAVHDACHSFL